MTLEHVREFNVPLRLIDQTLNPLREAGEEGFEAFVLWGGRDAGNGRFQFEAAYVPRQQATRGREGLLVTVDGPALFRANRAFYETGLTLAAQVHSHPGVAYHSDTDDRYPMMTLIGGLSAVVPNFGVGGAEGLTEWAWYRLAGPDDWAPVEGNTLLVFS